MASIFDKLKSAVKGVAYQVKPGGKTYADAQREREEQERRKREAAARAAAQLAARQQAAAARSKVSVATPQQRIVVDKPAVSKPSVVVSKTAPATPNIVLPNGKRADPNFKPSVLPPAPKKDMRSNFQKIKDQISVGDDKTFKQSEKTTNKRTVGETLGDTIEANSPQDIARRKTQGKPERYEEQLEKSWVRRNLTPKGVALNAAHLTQDIARVIPTAAVTMTESGRRSAKTAKASTISDLRKMSYEDRKRTIDNSRNSKNDGLWLVLQDTGIDLDNPTDENLDTALKGVSDEKPVTYSPDSAAERFLFGTDKEVQSYQQRGEGIEKETGIPAPVAALGLGALDFTPGGSGKSQVGKQLIKATTRNEVLEVLGKAGIKDISEEVIDQLVTTKNAKKVGQLLDQVIKQDFDVALKEGGERVADDAIDILDPKDLAGDTGLDVTRRYADDVEEFIEQVQRADPGVVINRSLAEDALVRSIDDQLMGRTADTGVKLKDAADLKRVGSRMNDELVNEGWVEPDSLTYMNRRDLELGADTLDDAIDESMVNKYKDDIMKGVDIDPIIVDENGFIQDGKHRLAALDELGIEDIPTVRQKARTTAVDDGIAVADSSGIELAQKPLVKQEVKKDIIDAEVDRLLTENATRAGQEKQLLDDIRKLGGIDPKSVDSQLPQAIRSKTAGQSADYLAQELNNLGYQFADEQDLLNTLDDLFMKGRETKLTKQQARELAEENIRTGKSPLSPDYKAADDITTPKERGFINTVKNSPLTDPAVKKELAKSEKYNPLRNVDTLAKADEVIAQDFEGAVEFAKTSPTYSTDTQAISLQLIDKLQAAGRHQDAVEIVEKMAQRATENGQANQILAAYNKLSPEGIVAAAQREITRAKTANPERYKNLNLSPEQAQALRDAASEVFNMPPGDEKNRAMRELLGELESVVPTSGIRKLTTLWKAGLLTGIKGAVGGNVVGNTSAAIMRKISDVPASMIDATIATIFGTGRSKTFTLKGMLGGLFEGAKVGAKNFKEGVGAESVVNKLDYKKTQYGKGVLGRAAQKYTDTVFNFYSAADRPFYHSALQNSLYDLAQAEAKNAGLRGRTARAFVKNLVKEPTDEILTAAVSAAEDAVFQRKNALGAALTGAKKGLADKGGAAGEAVGDIVFPFTGVPAAIATHVYNYSPAGAAVEVYKALRSAAKGNFDQAAQRKLSEALGKGLTGTGVMWLGMQLSNSGQMTLGYPTDPKERALWEQEGKTPYSILIDGKWRSMNYMGSIMSLMAIGGQIDQAESGGIDAIAEGVAGSGKAILGSTPLQGAQAGLNAVTDPQRYGDSYIENLAGSIVPTLSKDIATAMDDTQRDPLSITEAIASRIPGLRETVGEKLDAFGNPMPRPTSAVGAIVDPFKSSQDRSTPLTSELRRLQDAEQGIMPSKPDADFFLKDTELTDEQRREVLGKVNPQIQAVWNDIIGSPDYMRATDEEKKALLEKAANDIRAVAKIGLAGGYGIEYNDENRPKLTNSQRGFALTGDYTINTALGLPEGLSQPARDTLVNLERMNETDRDQFLSDGANEYAYELAKFEKANLTGEYSEPQKFEKLLTLGKLKVQTNYPKEARDLYKLSKSELQSYLEQNPVAAETVEQMLALDQELVNKGFISSAKYKYGIYGSGSGGGGGGGGRGGKKEVTPPRPKFGNFGLVGEVPAAAQADIAEVLRDYQNMINSIGVLQSRIAPESQNSIQLTTV